MSASWTVKLWRVAVRAMARQLTRCAPRPRASVSGRHRLHRHEVHLLPHRAIRAWPAVRDLRPARAGSEALARTALGLVVDVAAVGALVARGRRARGGGVRSLVAGEQLGPAVVERAAAPALDQFFALRR